MTPGISIKGFDGSELKLAVITPAFTNLIAGDDMNSGQVPMDPGHIARLRRFLNDHYNEDGTLTRVS